MIFRQISELQSQIEIFIDWIIQYSLFLNWENNYRVKVVTIIMTGPAKTRHVDTNYIHSVTVQDISPY